MQKWSNGAKKRLVEIHAAEDGEQDMRAIAASIAKLPWVCGLCGAAYNFQV